MFDSYVFVLEFMELDEDLIEEKIDRAIQYDYDNGNLSPEDEEGGKTLQEWQDDEDERKRCYNYIASYFPIYF